MSNRSAGDNTAKSSGAKWTAFFPKAPSIPSSSAGSLLGAGGANQTPKVYVHFFPVAAGVSAPYPVHAFIEIFSRGRVLAKQGFEGLRINQPDGLDLADVFPALFSNSVSQGSGAHVVRSSSGDAPVTSTEEFSRRASESRVSPSLEKAEPSPSLSPETELGLTVELSSPQPRIDLSRSRIMVELCYPSHRLRFHAVRFGDGGKSGVSGERGAWDSRAEVAQSIYGHDRFVTKLIEVSPGEDISTLPNEVRGEARAPSREVRSSEVDKRHAPQPSGYVQHGEFETAGRLPRALPEESDENEISDDERVRFLVQYEPTSALPVSVRCL